MRARHSPPRGWCRSRPRSDRARPFGRSRGADNAPQHGAKSRNTPPPTIVNLLAAPTLIRGGKGGLIRHADTRANSLLRLRAAVILCRPRRAIRRRDHKVPALPGHEHPEAQSPFTQAPQSARKGTRRWPCRRRFQNLTCRPAHRANPCPCFSTPRIRGWRRVSAATLSGRSSGVSLCRMIVRISPSSGHAGWGRSADRADRGWP